MAANSESIDRHIVPRWRPFREALRSGELGSGAVAKANAINGSAFFHEKEAAWLENRELPFAVDLVSAATVLGGSPEVIKAAEFILEHSDQATSLAQKLARSSLGVEQPAQLPADPQTRMQLVTGLHELKARRIAQPRNAFVWVDLARLYVILGQEAPARQALNVARRLAPTDRFVLRSTARFLHHFNEHEEALELLRSNPRTPYDSWLAAAEIAAASVLSRTPKFAKTGRNLLERGDVTPFHTSELATALASLEVYSGNLRAARRLFIESLREPTKNTLAQVVWASKRAGLGEVNADVLSKARASEALTLNDFNLGNWQSVIAQSQKWAQDEPFSARPHLLASSTAASFLDSPKDAEQIARAGLENNAAHPALINNLAFALVLQDRPEKAIAVLARVNAETVRLRERICLLATSGMVWFRLGNLPEGSRYYQAAIDMATGKDLEHMKVMAELYYAREMVLSGEMRGLPQFDKAFRAALKMTQTHIPALAMHLSVGLEKAAREHHPRADFLNMKAQAPKRGLLF